MDQLGTGRQSLIFYRLRVSQADLSPGRPVPACRRTAKGFFIQWCGKLWHQKVTLLVETPPEWALTGKANLR